MTQNYVEVLVRARDQGAKPEVADLRAKLNDLAGKVAEARAMVDDTEAAAKLDALQAKLLRLDRTTSRPNINMESAIRAESQLHTFESQFAKLGTTAWGTVGRTAGEQAGMDFTAAFGGRVRERAQPDVEKPLEDAGKKGGKAAGAAAAGGLSPMLIGAFTAAGTVGPAALLAGVGAATVGIAALVSKSNTQISQDYQVLGQNVSSTMQNAVAPIAGDLDAGIKTLEQGVVSVGPQLDQLFAAVGPDASQLAGGLVDLGKDALPGITSGLRDAQPIMHDVAVDAGKLGQGLGGFVDKLGGGAGGAATGLNALTKSASELLPDLGEIVGDLSNGLGPALRDVLMVATPVANVLTDVVHAVPPGAIEGAAVAVTALYAAFKVGTLTNVVAEGTTFLDFLKGSTVAAESAAVADVALGDAEEAMSLKATLAAKAQAAAATATEASSAAASAALGPWGALAGALFIATDEIDKHSKLELNPFDLGSKIYQAANTHVTAVGDAGKAIDQLANSFVSTSGKADLLTQALTTQREQIGTNAQTTAQATLAALGATNGQSQLVQSLYGTLTGYDAATTGANAYSTALTAVNGTTATLDDAQNSLAQQMLNAKTSFAQNGYSMDLNTQAGINNREALTSAAKAITQMATAQYQSTGNMDTANKTIQDQINQFVKNTGATGKNKDAIYQYLEALAKIPPDVTTNVHADLTPAEKALGDFLNQVNTSSGTVTIYGSNDSAGSSNFGRGFGAKSTGGNVGLNPAATGGMRSNSVLLGEYAPEIVDLPVGSRVHSGPDTQRMMNAAVSAGAGGGEPVRIEFVGDFFELIRNHVRVRGGSGKNSVQIAFGQTY